MNGIFINVLGPNRAFVTRLVKENEITLMHGSNPSAAIAWLGQKNRVTTTVARKTETRIGSQNTVDWEYVGETEHSHKFRTKEGKMVFIPQTTQVETFTKHVAKIVYVFDDESGGSFFREEVDTLHVSVLTVMMVRKGYADIAEFLQTNNRTGREFKRARIMISGAKNEPPSRMYAAASLMAERSESEESPSDASPGGVVEYSASIPEEVASQMMKNEHVPIIVSRVITLSRQTYGMTQYSDVEIQAHAPLMPGKVEMYDDSGALVVSGHLSGRSAADEPTVIGSDNWVSATVSRENQRIVQTTETTIRARLMNNGTAPVRAIFRVQEGAQEIKTFGWVSRELSHIPGFIDFMYGELEPGKSISIELIYLED